MKRGEVWWCEPPWHKRRPVCVLTRQRAIPVVHSVLVVSATTLIRGVATEVKLDEHDGMPRECVLTVDEIWSVPKSVLVERQTALTPVRMHQVCEALRLATGC